MLKQTISNIENFLSLFNPYTEYDLCRYWQQLEERGYDPVTEYNKRLEMFDMQYSPSPQTLFLVMLQISRFLKEFAEFETKFTPEFRHPNIQNKVIKRRKEDSEIQELESIEKAREFRSKHKVKIRNFLNPGQLPRKKKQRLGTELAWPFDSEDEIELPDQESLYEKEEDEFIDYLNDIGVKKEMDAMMMTDRLGTNNGLRPHEGVNIEVESGRVVCYKKGRIF